MQNDMTPQTIRARAYAARVTLNKLLGKAGVANSTFWRWERGDTGDIHPVTLARIDDALREFEQGNVA